ncbi:MAG: HAD-IC family P-type ATPase [Phycisphaerales bacterium]
MRTVAAELGLDDAEGAVSPESKAAEVHRLISAGNRVVMVGDGVNDAAALAGATVGIAVHGGAEASLEAADVYLREPGLAPIADLAERSASTMRTVRTVLTISIAYNALAATAAMLGVMSALAAAVLMPASSLTAVAIAMTAGRTRGDHR